VKRLPHQLDNLLVAVIAVIAAVGGWISKEWTALNSQLT
jgi:Flp pilus assembly pilin Flp